MRVLTDEHVSPVIANTLRSEGIHAVAIYDTPIVGKDDPDVLEFASENESTVLTNDQHFVTKEFVEETDHWGILFYEDQRTPRNDIVRSVRISEDRLLQIINKNMSSSNEKTVRGYYELPIELDVSLITHPTILARFPKDS